MPPKKKSGAGQLDLGKATPPPAASAPAPTELFEAPRLLRYLPLMQAEDWQVERFDLLAAEILADGQHSGDGHWGRRMQLFHEFAQHQTRGWLIVRRLYGIAPLVPGPNAHPDDLKTHTAAEIVDAAIVPDKATLAAELANLREQFLAAHPVEVVSQPVTPAQELLLDDALLEKFGFDKAMFQLVGYNRVLECDAPRSKEENRVEQNWFCEQLRYEKWQKMLVHKLYGDIARDALMNLLYLRRVQKEMAPLSSSHPRFKELNSQKTSFATTYQKQLDDLQGKFPELAISGETSLRGFASDMIIGNRDYYANGSNKLINRFCTAAEMEWMLRVAVQRPASFSLGLSVCIVEASKGAYDPNFRSQFKPAVLKILTAGFRSGAEACRTILNEPVVDLTKGVSPDEPDQFPDFVVPPEPEPPTPL